tara:strand:- start:8000 stop:8170 length:171 start_codon:yes stop_codon:yes gene_type:complete
MKNENEKETSFFNKKEKTTPAKISAKAPQKAAEKPKVKKELTQQEKNLERAKKLDR